MYHGDRSTLPTTRRAQPMAPMRWRFIAEPAGNRYHRPQLIHHAWTEYPKPLHSNVPGLQPFWDLRHASSSLRIVPMLRWRTQYAVFKR